MTMAIADQDKVQIAEIVNGLAVLSPMRRDVIELAIETAYAIGRRTGAGEAADLASRMLGVDATSNTGRAVDG